MLINMKGYKFNKAFGKICPSNILIITFVFKRILVKSLTFLLYD